MTELEKWENCYKERNLIKDFLDFAAEKHDATLRTEAKETSFVSFMVSVDEDKILDDYFQIDQQKLEEERRALLEKQKALIGE